MAEKRPWDSQSWWQEGSWQGGDSWEGESWGEGDWDASWQPPFDCYIVLDFEATCEEDCTPVPQEVIEFPLVVLDAAKGGRTVAEFRTFVRPVHHPKLSRFCQEFTGIQQAQVDKAPPWPQALARAEGWLDQELKKWGFKKPVFVTCGDWDLKRMMPKQCKICNIEVPERFNFWINVKMLFRRLMEGEDLYPELPRMLEVLGLQLQGKHHCGLDDCRNIARVVRAMLPLGDVLPCDVMVVGSAAEEASAWWAEEDWEEEPEEEPAKKPKTEAAA